MAALQALENREAFLLRMGSMFLEWTALGEQLAIAGERLRLTEQQLEQVESKRSANLVDELDVLRSEDTRRIARQGLLLVESQWKAKRAELAVLARLPELESLTPQFDLYQRVDHGSSDEILGRLKQDSRLLGLVAKRTGAAGAGTPWPGRAHPAAAQFGGPARVERRPRDTGQFLRL